MLSKFCYLITIGVSFIRIWSVPIKRHLVWVIPAKSEQQKTKQQQKQKQKTYHIASSGAFCSEVRINKVTIYVSLMMTSWIAAETFY